MRPLISLSSVLVGVVLLGACGPAPDSEADAAAGTESAVEGGMSAAEAAQDLSCWLGDGTMEEALQRISPLGETEIALGDHIGKICYGRPSARGRVVEGGLIPFGEPWRIGAN